MKRVPADEFARHAAEYLEGSETVSVEKDGEVIGRYVPAPNGRMSDVTTAAHQTATGDAVELDWSKVDPESRAIIERLQSTLREIYARTGMTEDELVDLLDPKKPFPYDLDPES
jgi:hypothetical protein